MDKIKTWTRAVTEVPLWAVILIPVLSISWIGFYTIARDVGIPPIFAAGLSAAFDGIAIFAARIGLRHRRKGFSGYLARITVIAFAALGAFVQSFHSQTHAWILAHSWIVWATAPVAAVLCYELHLGWVHRKQLVRMGYHHPSAKSGFGPMTWIHFPRETLDEYRRVLRARRSFIAKSNLARFGVEESRQPQLRARPEPVPTPRPESLPTPERPVRPPLRSVPNGHPNSRTRPASPAVSTGPKRSPRKSANVEAQEWCKAHGFTLGYNGRVPVAGLRAYRAACRSGAVDATARVG